MSNVIKAAIKRFVRNEEGASGIEYALVAAMVALVLVALIPDISGAVKGIFDKIETALTTANTAN